MGEQRNETPFMMRRAWSKVGGTLQDAVASRNICGCLPSSASQSSAIQT